MSVLYVLIGASMVLGIGFVIAFYFSYKNGQFDDELTPSIRILFDDESPKTKK